ncbi:EAL domain-containing protein [Gilvimarinus agarilyticus]|uniref:putative bifunctional diguanylate cyclase/phosphodiesterase n=1 Tax=Gilvimarinus sp. 2_MG-2023 TaxID=3062666 RepID=UPI001C092DDC|nr:EAL domain-containing protein [Gilvimarinus sp. 2_MG-2023]MBU2887267.1 EAL domain-containing protein [Gilvimarinus agarilyticus]MDO6571926.1 EAL domain-containing protein [Gilvimarinus sp. 2_MG-2023]
MRQKKPSFFQGISFQLAKIGIILAILLSFFISAIQVYIDYLAQSKELDQLIYRVAEVATPPAARAVHTLDADLANEVVNGLLTYDFIYQVAIWDERGNVLAQADKALTESDVTWMGGLFTHDDASYSSDLIVAGYEQMVAGKISFTVDRDRALENFYRRSEINFFVSSFRSLILVVLLFVAFYFKLTKPLVQLSHEINEIDPDRPGAKRLTTLKSHKADELGTVINSSNQILDVIELSLAKRRVIEQALRTSEEHLRQIVDSLPVFIGARNADGYYLFANKALAEMLGHTPEDMRNVHISDLLKSSVLDVDTVIRGDARVINNGEEIDVAEESFVSASGEQLYLQTHMMPLQYYEEVVCLVVSMDVTERKLAQAKMEHMAHHDALTGLPNRLQLVERLEHEARRAVRHGYFGAVLFIDLDKFKNINDSLGHPVGDSVLQEVSSRLQSAVREEDLVARLSGDEFVVVLTVLDHNQEVAALKAGEVGEKIRALISQAFIHEDMELRITCSVGVVVYPEKNNVVHELLRYADTAMYQVKEKGRDAIEFFNEDMADKVSRQLVMEGELHRALEEEQFVLYFQPKVDVQSGAIVGAEALLRWFHPEQGIISPFEFIPVLETSGLIIEVGQWVLEQACDVVQKWSKAGLWHKGMQLSLNISPRQFRRDSFASDVIKTIEQYNLPDQTLDMEITEGIVIQQIEEAIETITLLTQNGISFSLDDFGTGYSSISYLKRLPVTTLKIDKSFIRDIIDDRNDRVLVETIVTMGRLLGLGLVAEGVENSAQLDIIKSYGCHYYQGFYFSPPVPADQFIALLEKRPSK